MIKGVPIVVLLFILTFHANAQIQKTVSNRVYVDEDYEYTETARRDRSAKEQLEKGTRLYNSGDYRAAADAFSVAAQLNPSLFVVQFNLGMAQIHLADYESAMKTFQAAVRLDEASASAWHFLGFVFHNLSRDDEARRCYLRALELDQKSGVTWNNLGQIYLAAGKLDDAVAAFEKALTFEPDSVPSVNGLCAAYARSKKSEEAVSFCGKARAAKQTLTVTYYLAWSYLDLKRFEEAIELLNECVRLDPKNPDIYLALTEGYYHLKRYPEALSFAEKARQLNPDSQSPYASMGHIYFEMKKPKEAKRLFEEALALQPKSPIARYNLALTCLALNQKDCAREQYAILKTVEPVLSTQLLDQIYGSKILRLAK